MKTIPANFATPQTVKKTFRLARLSRWVAVIGLLSVLLLVRGQGLNIARSSEIAASVEQSQEAERADRKPDGTDTKAVAAAGSEKSDQADETMPYVRAVKISSRPQERRSGYGIGDEVSVAVTFSEPVEVTGTPLVGLWVGKDAQQAIYESGADTSKLVFAYSVAEGDEDADGLGIEPNSLSLDGGTIRGKSGNEAVLDHEELGDDPDHKVDGIRPALAAGKEASVKKDTLMLTFVEALDGLLTPEAERFTVKVEGKRRDISRIVVGGRTVRLSLASAVKAGEPVTVSYTAEVESEAQPVRDTAGNGASGFTEQAVTNRTGTGGDRAGGTLPLRTVRQIEALLAKKAERTPSQRKVSSRILDALPEPGEQAPARSRREAAETDAPEGLVTVDIRANVTPDVLSRIRALGGIVLNSVPKYRAIRAQLPPGAVEPLARMDDVQTIQPGDMARTRGQTSPVPAVVRADVPDTPVTRKDDTSGGDTAHRANVARRTHSVTGAGIGIGVISNGVRTLAERQKSGDLPPQVNVLPGARGSRRRGHGNA